MTQSILTVSIPSTLTSFLSQRKYTLTNFETASEKELCQVVSNGRYDALLLGDEYSLNVTLVEQLRRLGCKLPILGLHVGPRSVTWSHVCVEFLEAGGDNLIPYPCESEEVARCIELGIKHAIPPTYEVLRYQAGTDVLQIRPRRMQVILNDAEVPLTRSELEILIILARYKRTITIREIVERLYDVDFRDNWINNVRVFICRIRKEIGDQFLHTERGDGYVLLGRIHPK